MGAIESRRWTYEFLKLATRATEVPLASMMREAVEDVFRQKFCGGVFAFELRHLVEVFIVQRLEHLFKRIQRAADIDHDTIRIERVGDERGIDHEGRAVHRLRRAEDRAAKRMGNHDVVADFDGEQGKPLKGN